MKGNVKRFNLLAVVAVLVLALWRPGPVLSQQEAIYNLASIQPDKHLEIEAGGHSTALLYFYNIDGNRTTHIKLKLSSCPENWQVEIQPPLQQTVIDTANGSISLLENLCVEPSILQSEKIAGLPDGMESVVVPGRGYTMAKVVHVTIGIPALEKAGDKGEVIVTAEATWSGQQGAASIGQTRDFVFSVEVVPANIAVTGDREREAKEAALTVGKEQLGITVGLAFLLIIGLLSIVKTNKID